MVLTLEDIATLDTTATFEVNGGLNSRPARNGPNKVQGSLRDIMTA